MKKIDWEKYKKVKILMNSASFALVLSIAFFIYQTIDSKREFMGVVNNLMQIENSLSTRYLGVFPEYLGNINGLLEESINNHKALGTKDSVVIFQDVLYYGIRSDVDGFKRMMRNILELSNNGSHITIAYYNPEGLPFKQMMLDKLVSDKYQEAYRRDMNRFGVLRRDLLAESAKLRQEYSGDSLDVMMRALVEKHYGSFCEQNAIGSMTREDVLKRFNDRSFIDSLVSQRYYDSTRLADISRFDSSLRGITKKIPVSKKSKTDVEKRVNQLCVSLDSVKSRYLDRPVGNISYSDYVNTYKGLSYTICEMLDECENVDLLPLNESLMMGCWMCNVNGMGKAIFAFPSKYSTDEIGFTSQDAAFINYIKTMLSGVRKRVVANESAVNM